MNPHRKWSNCWMLKWASPSFSTSSTSATRLFQASVVKNACQGILEDEDVVCVRWVVWSHRFRQQCGNRALWQSLSHRQSLESSPANQPSGLQNRMCVIDRIVQFGACEKLTRSMYHDKLKRNNTKRGRTWVRTANPKLKFTADTNWKIWQHSNSM